MKKEKTITQSSESTLPVKMNKQAASLTKKEEFFKFFLFAVFSLSAGAIQIISFTLLNELCTLPYWPSYLIALILSVLYNFTINRRFTFKSASNIPVAMLWIFAFYCVFTPLSTLWGNALANIGWNEYIVLLGTMAINLITEFLWCRFFVYKNSINTNIKADDNFAKK